MNKEIENIKLRLVALETHIRLILDRLNYKHNFNPMHYCLNCDKYLGFRGYCSQKCHDEWYDKNV